MAAMLIAYAANVYGSKILPYWQNAVFAIHILGYFGFLVPVWVSLVDYLASRQRREG